MTVIGIGLIVVTIGLQVRTLLLLDGFRWRGDPPFESSTIIDAEIVRRRRKSESQLKHPKVGDAARAVADEANRRIQMIRNLHEDDVA